MRKYKFFIIVLISSFILFNMASKELFQVILMPHEWIILLLFGYLFLKHSIVITWVDKAFFIYFTFAIILPFVLNFQGKLHGVIGLFLPFKIWMVFFITSTIIRLNIPYISYRGILIEIFEIIIFSSLFAGIIGIIRFMDIPFISDQINTIWPIKGVGLDPAIWGRLVSTMSDTNGTGIFFTAVFFLSLYSYDITGRIFFLYTMIFFILIIILTGSFTSLGTLIIVGLLIYRSKVKRFFRSAFSIKFTIASLIFFFILLQIPVLKKFLFDMVERRIEFQFRGIEGQSEYMPTNLYGRAIRWNAQVSIIKERPLFGFATEIPTEALLKSVDTANPHNYYIYVLMHSGIMGFLGYSSFIFVLISNSLRIRMLDKEKKLVVSIIFVGLLSQITSLTFQYGGYSELFGVNMALISFLSKHHFLLYKQLSSIPSKKDLNY